MATVTSSSLPSSPTRLAAFALITLVAIDLCVRALCLRTDLLTQIVDIQTPATLYAKLDYLRRFEGTKVVLVGDSVVYGRAMLEAGDKDWRRHTLSQRLQDRLSGAGLTRPVLVLNLGMNGALPTDIEELLKLVVPLGVDKVVLDVTLRSFSADFAIEGKEMSRQWLNSMAISPEGRYAERPESRSFAERIESWIRTAMINHWMLYRLRDFIQWLVLDGEPSSAVRGVRNALNAALRGTFASSPEERQLQAALLMLRAKNRHETVNLAPANPQRAAFDRTLRFLAARGQPTVLFYATEDRMSIGSIMEEARYRDLLEGLCAMIATIGAATTTYLPPQPDHPSESYVDYVHPNARGYDWLADRLFGIVRAGLN